MDAGAWIALAGLLTAIAGAAGTLLWRISQQVAVATRNLNELESAKHKHGKRIGRLETRVFGGVRDEDHEDDAEA